jgi:hypothetical protein
MGCTLLQGTAIALAGAAVVLWVLAVATYVSLWRQFDGPRSRLVFSSLWLMRPGSLGERAEPARRRLGRLFVLFMLTIVATIGIAALASGVCGPG